MSHFIVTMTNQVEHTTVIVRVYAATFSPNFMSKSMGASYMCISSFKPFFPHKISRQNQQDTASVMCN